MRHSLAALLAALAILAPAALYAQSCPSNVSLPKGATRAAARQHVITRYESPAVQTLDSERKAAKAAAPHIRKQRRERFFLTACAHRQWFDRYRGEFGTQPPQLALAYVQGMVYYDYAGLPIEAVPWHSKGRNAVDQVSPAQLPSFLGRRIDRLLAAFERIASGRSDWVIMIDK